MARAFQLLVVQRRRYARPGGYDAEHYWRDRLARHGLSLRGPGREGRSELDNIADYKGAAERFRGYCREEGLELRGAAVMDIGCGTGAYAAVCRDEGVGAYVGVDITDVLFHRLCQQFPTYQFLKRDVTSDPLSGRFHLILMIDVVEHIVTEQQLDAAMQNVRRCLAPGGTLVLAFPSPGHWPTRLFYVRRWREADITRLFEGYVIGRPQPFRDGSILALRKPRV